MVHHLGEILTVDDNPLNLDLLGSLLGERGYKVRAATNGKRAVEVAKLSPPDLIMLDISMPEMDGYEACRRLKADPDLSAIPIIFISALDDPLDKVKAFRMGGADYVTKPFQAEEVLARVEHQLLIAGLQDQLKEQNKSLEEVNLRLRALDKMKASFTAMLVHDLRSPFTPFVLAMDHYRKEGRIPADVVDCCESSMRQALDLMNELLEVLRSEGTEPPIEVAPFIPAELLEQVRRSFAPLAEAGGLRFEASWEGLPPLMRGDSQKLERVFSNLLGNALKFTPPEGQVRLRAFVEPGGGGTGPEASHPWLGVEVEDTGKGISAEQLPHVFDPYHQSSFADRDLGVGLGLAIVQRIVAAHQGRIDVRSQVGAGSTFTVRLPLF